MPCTDYHKPKNSVEKQIDQWTNNISNGYLKKKLNKEKKMTYSDTILTVFDI